MTSEEPAAASFSARSASQWKTILLCERPSNAEPRGHARSPYSIPRRSAEKAQMGQESCTPFRPVVFHEPAGLSSGPAKVLQRSPLPLPALVHHRRWLAARDRELQQQREDAAQPKSDGVANFSSRLRTKIREGKGDLGFWRAARNARTLRARQESLPGRAHSVLERVAIPDGVDPGEGGVDAVSRKTATSARAQSACSVHHREGLDLETIEDADEIEHNRRESSTGEEASTSNSTNEGKGATPKKPFRRRRGEIDTESLESPGLEKGTKASAPDADSSKGGRPRSALNWKRRPKWALTENDVDALDAEEADRLLEFVLGLDFSSYSEKVNDDLKQSIERVELEAYEAEEQPEAPLEDHVNDREIQPASSTVPSPQSRSDDSASRSERTRSLVKISVKHEVEAFITTGSTRSIQDGRCDSPSLSSAGEDTWTLAAAIRRQERPVLGVHSTASIKTLIDQAARPRTPAA